MNVTLEKTISKSRPVRTKRPVNYDPADERWFPRWGDYDTNDLEVFRFSRMNVTDKGVLFDGLQTFPKAVVHTDILKQFNSLYLLKVYLRYRKARIDDGKMYILAFDPWAARNYYHWVVDTLSRLFSVRELLPEAVVLFPRNARRYQYESVGFFRPKEILELAKHTYIRPETLVLPRPVADSGKHDGPLLRGMSDYIGSCVDAVAPAITSGERVYVSRSRQKVRRISNERDVIALLQQHSFSVVFFEELSFPEQVAVMRRARIVVSNHGANLANTLFMPEGASLLELNSADNPNFCYWSLATNLNLAYYYQLCPKASAAPDPDNSADIVVDLTKLRANLAALLAT
jgi:capsular polysaccharide biosynthesis protein